MQDAGWNRDVLAKGEQVDCDQEECGSDYDEADIGVDVMSDEGNGEGVGRGFGHYGRYAVDSLSTCLGGYTVVIVML